MHIFSACTCTCIDIHAYAHGHAHTIHVHIYRVIYTVCERRRIRREGHEDVDGLWGDPGWWCMCSVRTVTVHRARVCMRNCPSLGDVTDVHVAPVAAQRGFELRCLCTPRQCSANQIPLLPAKKIRGVGVSTFSMHGD